jgi:opacity protein-like surface antigen
MKKHIGTIVLVFMMTAAASAGEFSLSAGAGGIAGGFFTRYTLTAEGIVQGGPIRIDAGQETNQFNYGFLAFFDATYGEFNVFYQRGINTYRDTADFLASSGGLSGKGWESVLGVSLVGKYPFYLNKQFTIFPLLGAEYQICLVQKRAQPDGYVYDRTEGIRETDKDGNAFLLKDWNSMWINLGGGVDWTLTGNFFIRGELLYSLRLKTGYEKKNVELMKSLSGDPDPSLAGLTSGPSVRISAGYRFYTK